MKYAIIKHDYKNKLTKTIKVLNSLHNATNYLEEISVDNIIQSNGDKYIIHGCHCSSSRYFRNLNYGKFLMKDANESLYKLYIMEKILIEGTFYNSYEIIKLLYYEIVRIDEPFINNEKYIDPPDNIIKNQINLLTELKKSERFIKIQKAII